MLKSKVDTLYVKKKERKQISQGDILKDIFIIDVENDVEGAAIKKITLPFCVVMSQECDLDLDYKARNNELSVNNNDKYLPTVLVCPAYQEEKFFQGDHIDGWKMEEIRSSSDKNRIKLNSEKNRVHYLHGDTELRVPFLIIDFKHFYTVPRDLLYSQFQESYLVTINELFRESLSQRFANYLSRFGLPVLNTKGDV